MTFLANRYALPVGRVLLVEADVWVLDVGIAMFNEHKPRCGWPCPTGRKAMIAVLVVTAIATAVMAGSGARKPTATSRPQAIDSVVPGATGSEHAAMVATVPLPPSCAPQKL